MSENKIVPFGKHKGKPVEELIADQGYCEWLMAQPGFRERYPQIYQVIVNYGQEPTETPEHNSLQVLFLDEQYVHRFINHIRTFRNRKPLHESVKIKVKFEVNGIDVLLSYEGSSKSNTVLFAEEAAAVERTKNDLTDYKKLRPENLVRYPESPLSWLPYDKARWTQDQRDTYKRKEQEYKEDLRKYEVEDKIYRVRLAAYEPKEKLLVETAAGALEQFSNAVDEFDSENRFADICVEIKPFVGDDYPAVLRQIRGNLRQGYNSVNKVLFTRAYTGVGATEKQFIKFFESAEIRVVFERDV